MAKATRIWNRFDTWIWQEDTLVPWTARLIEWNNVTWLATWLGLTLWPKVHKLFLTNGAMRNFYIDNSTSDESEYFAYWAGWEIYNFTSADNTPIYTHTNLSTIEWFFEADWDYFFQPSSPTTLAKSTWDSFTDVDEDYYDWVGGTPNNVSTVTSKWYIYYPNGTQITKFDENGVFVKNITGFEDNVLAFIPNWGNLYAYTQNRVYWLTIANNADTISSESALWFTVRGSTVYNNITYLVTDHWEFKAWNAWQFTNISNPILTNRLNDNSDYTKKFDFGRAADRWNTITSNGRKLYMWSNDWIPWIYTYGSIVPWLSNWFHKEITQTQDWVQIDEIYCVAESRANEKIYFAYRAWTEYWVSYIDLDSKETAQLWYWVTEVFTWNTSFYKRPEELRFTVEWVSGNNYVKLYERVNNWAWTLLRTVTWEDGIIKKEIKNYTKENIEVQFKVELYNESWTTPPIVRELYYLSDVTNK